MPPREPFLCYEDCLFDDVFPRGPFSVLLFDEFPRGLFSVLYVSQETKGRPLELLDPNELEEPRLPCPLTLLCKLYFPPLLLKLMI